jgi:hypothetical protein
MPHELACDPHAGGPLQLETVKLLRTGEVQWLREGPNDQEQDWVVLFRKRFDCYMQSDGSRSKMVAGATAGFVIGFFAAVVLVACNVHHFDAKHVRALRNLSLHGFIATFSCRKTGHVSFSDAADTPN